jgi:hypothetical protein
MTITGPDARSAGPGQAVSTRPCSCWSAWAGRRPTSRPPNVIGNRAGVVAGLQGNRLPLLRSTAMPSENRNDITTGCPESVRVLVSLGEDVVEPVP